MDTSLSLACPFCCDEKFSSHHSLKYHILSIVDNLWCPACNMRFDDILQLVEHLGRECKENEIDALCSSTNEEVPVNVDINTNIDDNSTIELEENEQGKSIENDDEVSYMCVMCNVQFTNIKEHLDKYHDGEEVVMENGDEPETKEGEAVDGSTSPPENGTYDYDVTPEYIEDEEQRIPLTRTYINDNGELRKLTEKDVGDTGSLIQVHECRRCRLQFPMLDHFTKHYCDPDKLGRKFSCEHCPYVFPDQRSLAAHTKSHKAHAPEAPKVVTVKPPECDVCNTMFPSYKSLRLHQRMHDPVKSRGLEVNQGEEGDRPVFECGVCHMTYDREYEEIHMRSHEEGTKFDCSICNRKFQSLDSLEMHDKAHTTNAKTSSTFLCSYCKKHFNSEEALREHVSASCQQREFVCQYCGKRFARPHEKVKHERIHTGEKPHVCQICGKAFRVSYCLTLHLRTHSDTRPYQCEHCGKRFKSHGTYNHHVLTHSDVRAYRCPFCPKAFKTSVQLAGHKNSHIKPFSCKTCNRPFASLYAVRAHMETHQRENNLKLDCWVCGATYARAVALRDHVKSQHPEHGDAADAEDDDVEYDETKDGIPHVETEMEIGDAELAPEEDGA